MCHAIFLMWPTMQDLRIVDASAQKIQVFIQFVKSFLRKCCSFKPAYILRSSAPTQLQITCIFLL